MISFRGDGGQGFGFGLPLPLDMPRILNSSLYVCLFVCLFFFLLFSQPKVPLEPQLPL